MVMDLHLRETFTTLEICEILKCREILEMSAISAKEIIAELQQKQGQVYLSMKLATDLCDRLSCRLEFLGQSSIPIALLSYPTLA